MTVLGPLSPVVITGGVGGEGEGSGMPAIGLPYIWEKAESANMPEASTLPIITIKPSFRFFTSSFPLGAVKTIPQDPPDRITVHERFSPNIFNTHSKEEKPSKPSPQFAAWLFFSVQKNLRFSITSHTI
jgi:hypothetical protein